MDKHESSSTVLIATIRTYAVVSGKLPITDLVQGAKALRDMFWNNDPAMYEIAIMLIKL